MTRLIIRELQTCLRNMEFGEAVELMTEELGLSRARAEMELVAINHRDAPKSREAEEDYATPDDGVCTFTPS